MLVDPTGEVDTAELPPVDIIYVGSKPWFNFLLHRVWDEVGFGGGVAVLKPVTVIFKSLCSKEHEAQVTLGVGELVVSV